MNRIWHRRVLLGLGLAFSLMTGNAAQAQGKPAPDPQAEAYYNAGVAAAKKATSKQDWEKICEQFTQAYALEKNPQIAANLGHAELKAGRWRLAAEHLDYFLQVDKEASKEARKEIEGLLEQARKHIVTVQISVNQAGAKIFIDDVERGVSPLEGPIYLEENEHTFEVRKAGMKAEKQSEVLKKGEKREMRFEMVADVGASIAPRNDVSKEKEPAWRTGLTVAAGMVGFVGVGGGITLIFMAEHYHQKAITYVETREENGWANKPGCEYPPYVADCAKARKELSEKADDFLGLGIASLIIGTAASAGMFSLLGTSTTKEPKVHVQPIVGQSYSGFMIEGKF